MAITYSIEPPTGLVREPVVSWDASSAVEKISSGLPLRFLEGVQEELDLTHHELADTILMSPRTLTRRKKAHLLPPDESERVYRVARIVDLAALQFGSVEEARAWLKEPNYALGEKTPLEMIRTEPGARLVERVLTGIEHGLPV